MAKLIIGGAELRFVDIRYDDKSKQIYHRLNFKADLKKNLAEEMGWDVLDPDGNLRSGLAGSVNLEGFGTGQLKCTRMGDEQGSLPGMEPKTGKAAPVEIDKK